MNIEELMTYMLNLFNNISNSLSGEIDKLSEIDMELSDLDHYIENNSLKSYELAKVGKLRKTLRHERREIKNNIAMIEVVKKFTDKYNGKFITRDIIQNLKEQKKLLKRQENPVYTYRTEILKRLEKTNEDTSDRPSEM